MSIATIPITTRKIAKSEYQELIDFDDRYNIHGSVYPSSEAPPPLTLVDLEEAHRRGDRLYWLCSSTSNRVGYYWTEKRSHSLFLSALIIATEFKNKKIGRQVLHWVDESCTKYGLSRCELTVSPLNLPALHLYLSHGYQIVNCETNYFGDSWANRFRVVLEKEMKDRFENIENFETVQVLCSDYSQLVQVTTNGYRGVILNRSQDGFQSRSSITFRKHK